MHPYRKTKFSMFIDVPYPAINYHATSSEIIGSGRHETSPTGRIKTLRLLDVHDLSLFVEIREMSRRRGRRLITHLNHFYRNCRAKHFGLASPSIGRPHGDAIEETTEWVFELDQCISDLGVEKLAVFPVWRGR